LFGRRNKRQEKEEQKIRKGADDVIMNGDDVIIPVSEFKKKKIKSN